MALNSKRKPGRLVFVQNGRNTSEPALETVGSDNATVSIDAPAEASPGASTDADIVVQKPSMPANSVGKELSDVAILELGNGQASTRLLAALRAARNGDFTTRLPEGNGLGEIATTFNELISLNQAFSRELGRVSQVVGDEGRLSERVALGAAQGSWGTNVNAVNGMIDNLAKPTTEVARVLTSVAAGDLSQQMALSVNGRPLKGEFLRIGNIVNTMVGQLNTFASEVTRVAREVGTEGKLGGQAQVEGVSGTWKDLTDNVNLMASNLTSQVRNITKVATAISVG
ncbi:MAG: HAMP domain-containing protein, partial [Cyanobacteria bacterium P01_F01_bin.116]